MTTGCLVLARDDPEASWVARGERPWIKHAVDHPLSESEELGTSQIPGASHTPRPPTATSVRAPTARWIEAAFCQSFTCQPLHHVDHRCLLSSPRCLASCLAADSVRVYVCVCVCLCMHAWAGGQVCKRRRECTQHESHRQAGEPSNNSNSFIQQMLPKFLQCTKHREPPGLQGVPLSTTRQLPEPCCPLTPSISLRQPPYSSSMQDNFATVLHLCACSAWHTGGA